MHLASFLSSPVCISEARVISGKRRGFVSFCKTSDVNTLVVVQDVNAEILYCVQDGTHVGADAQVVSEYVVQICE